MSTAAGSAGAREKNDLRKFQIAVSSSFYTPPGGSQELEPPQPAKRGTSAINIPTRKPVIKPLPVVSTGRCSWVARLLLRTLRSRRGVVKSEPSEAVSEALKSFLAEVGGEVESSATFTVDPVSALEKLSGFQLPKEGLWAVKLVQGAVAAGASSIAFTMERKRIRFRCEGGLRPGARRLLNLVCSGSIPKDRGERHWVTALRGAYGLGGRVCWSGWEEDGPQTVTIQGTEVSWRDEPGRLLSSLEVVVEFESGSVGRRETASAYATLCEACRFCHVPVLVDNRMVSRQPVHDGKPDPHLVIWAEPPVPGEQAFCLHPHPTPTPEHFCAALREVSQSLPECAVFLRLKPLERAESKVYWSQDGALLGPYKLTFEQDIAIEMVLPGDNLRTDLSEWVVVEADRAIPLETLRRAASAIKKQLEAGPLLNPVPRPLAVRVLTGLAEASLLLVGNVVGLATMTFVVTDPLGRKQFARNTERLVNCIEKLIQLQDVEVGAGQGEKHD